LFQRRSGVFGNITNGVPYCAPSRSVAAISSGGVMSDRKTFQDSITPLPAQEGLTQNGLMVNAATPEHRNEKLTLLFSVALPSGAQARLEEKVAKGEVVSPNELQTQYVPQAADVDKLTAWLKSQGFEIMQRSSDNTGVYARATVDQIEKSLAVNMVRVTRD